MGRRNTTTEVPSLGFLCAVHELCTGEAQLAVDDRMNENDQDVVHAGIISKSQKLPEFKSMTVMAPKMPFIGCG